MTDFISFEQASYLIQVRKLRELAVEVLKQYPLKVGSIGFIKYSANAIFKVTDTQNKKYVLRINPAIYHSKEAISEEIKWLRHILKTSDLIVPKPINSNDGEYVIECKHSTMASTRFCTMFEWIPGKIRWKSIDIEYAFQLGSIIAELQKNGKDVTVHHRNYWSADGLVGTDKAKFHNVEILSQISTEEQTIITKARKLAYQKLKHYEDSHQDQSGLIHGDMQPNNFLFHKNRYAVIDFDDCGVGLYVDDLATALFAFEFLTEGDRKKSFLELKDALFEGYAEYMPLTQDEIDLIPYFLLTRRLVTIAWLELRKGNPKLNQYFREAISRAIRYFQLLEKGSMNTI